MELQGAKNESEMNILKERRMEIDGVKDIADKFLLWGDEIV